ncbi:hypothetical protein ASE01_07140 [Nocardioides sp. Root190]|uniref:amino acid ABC transporter permease n=1 Tax=Nocardioides sp. Root190 TaxID=1736488 RepID=UPI0006F57737|nr:amino acid ABC transporter permease [Nocardioides sp. Root190]KRB77946.1 hypothetical protein ASE01_07140 [Nocardioides sp. Root190]
MDAITENWDLYFRSFGYTVTLFVIAAVLSMLFGTLLCALRVGPVAIMRAAATTYVTLVRNTPLVVVFAFFSFAAPMFGLTFSFLDVHIGQFDFTEAFGAAVVSMTLYTSAFVCEALRSGINAVPLGQAEAARAVGLTFGGTMTQVVLPQAIRASVPPLASVQIAMLKNTSVAAAFGILEAVGQMRRFTNNFSSQRTEIFIFFALGYVILVLLLSFAASRLERKWRIA